MQPLIILAISESSIGYKPEERLDSLDQMIAVTNRKKNPIELLVSCESRLDSMNR